MCPLHSCDWSLSKTKHVYLAAAEWQLPMQLVARSGREQEQELQGLQLQRP
eukprot:COSAG05_NODE_13692_length_421_cov_0.543478_1_plen_50_part_10